MNLQACLPEELQSPHTTVTRIAAGLSGAGVYRVEAHGQAFALKVYAEGEPIESWRARLSLLRLAADAGVAPQVVHADEAHRSVLSAFVVDRSFPALFMDPRTRAVALTLLGQTLRRVHELPLPSQASAADPVATLVSAWSELRESFALPAFVGETIHGVLAQPPPPRDRLVLCHNDVNPSNLLYDGERVLLVDWDVAAPNHPLYDLATIAVFLRMDDETCRQLLAAHDGAPVLALPAGFAESRRLVAALCGTIMLRLARQGGHRGATGDETLDSTPSLSDVFQRMRAGTLSAATADGQWSFGLALVKTSAVLFPTAT